MGLGGCRIEFPQHYFLWTSFSLNSLLLDEGLWIQTSTAPSIFFYLFLLDYLALTMRLWDKTSTTSLYFSCNSPLLDRGRGFNSHSSHIFSLYFWFSFTALRPWVQFPRLTFLFSSFLILLYFLEVVGSIPTPHISFISFSLLSFIA